jgi:uncharacterized protein YyaL (SSP411 family)
VNRLAAETSPYLRQHADNPVEWYPWGDEAFAEARQRDVPIFLSVGYSSCHWCHVMAHESFEHTATAEVMNRLFVNVKVDREERPDIDAIYMEATQAMTGRGGWPMSVWLTPDARPFYAGTYFPRTDRSGMPGFVRVCEAIAEAWTERREQVTGQAGQLTASIGRRLPVVNDATIGDSLLTGAVSALREQFDTRFGGFGRAPKFPPAQALLFLAREQVRRPAPATRAMLTITLDAMAAGGMYDHLGGGFARYSVDDYWLIPHFEKMLYDNALLTRAYTHGWLVAGTARYARVVDETIGYVLRDLRHRNGGFYSAEDADSEGVEGKFYAWSLGEVREVCGADADAAIAYYGITENGNFVDPHTEFRGNVLHAVDRFAEPDPVVSRARARLLARRAARVRPGLDDKILTAWNALMIRALAEAAWVFDRREWMDSARSAAEFALSTMRRSDGRLLRSWQADAGEARHLAYCEDYAALLEALLTLAEYDDLRWLRPASDIADAMIELFADPDGGFYATGIDAEPLIVRPQDFTDNAVPSENSMAAVGLLRLAALTGDARYHDRARAAVLRFAPLVSRAPSAFGYAIEAIERLVESPVEVVIVGDDDRAREMSRVVARHLLTSAVVVRSQRGEEPLELLEGRAGERGRGYVCTGGTCKMPAGDAARLEFALEGVLSARR